MIRTESRPWDGLHGWDEKNWAERVALAEYYVDASHDNEMCDPAWAQDLLRETLVQAHREGALVVRDDAPRPRPDLHEPRPGPIRRIMAALGRGTESRAIGDRSGIRLDPEHALSALLRAVAEYAPSGGTLHQKSSGSSFRPGNPQETSRDVFDHVLEEVEMVPLEALARASVRMSGSTEPFDPSRKHAHYIAGVATGAEFRMQWIDSSHAAPAMLMIRPFFHGDRP